MEFKVGDICVLTNTEESGLVFSVGSRVKILKLSHYRPGVFTVTSIDDCNHKGLVGYAFPKELRHLTPLEELL